MKDKLQKAYEAKAKLNQLYLYTQDVAKFLNIRFEQGGRNSYGEFADGMPCGAIMHYTASNACYGRKRPYGRYPTLLNRFARGSKQGVGVQFVVWDTIIPRFKEIRDRYPLLSDMPAEVAYMGDDLAFWHAGSANRWAYGIEIRNIGKLTRSSAGDFFWNHGKTRYVGRPPIKVGKSWWEPYSRVQMEAVLWVNRLMAAVHPIRPERFLGHTHISNTRIDPGPHFPIHEMRRYSVLEPDVPVSELKFLDEFSDDDDLVSREDPMISEEGLHQGKYRHDWDGCSDWSEAPGTAPRLIVDRTATQTNFKVMLESLGYYTSIETLDDTVALFRSRWKERKPSGRGFRNMLTANGGMTRESIKLLTVMARQWDRM